MVCVLDNARVVQRLQEGHGGWTDEMTAVCIAPVTWYYIFDQHLLLVSDYRTNWTSIECRK